MLHRFANHDIRGTIGKCVVSDIFEEAKGERDGRKTGRVEWHKQLKV